MPLFEVQVVHRIRYNATVRTKDEDEARDRANALWMDRIKDPSDEDVEISIIPVAYKTKKKAPATKSSA